MKKALLIGLSVLATLVSASPYIPYTHYTAHKEESKNVQLSDDEPVAAAARYFKNEIEKENLQPANGQQKKPLTDGDTIDNSEAKKDVVCVDQGTSNSLQRIQLEMILDTVYPITGNPTPFKTLITPDHGVTMYTTELNPLSAYQIMLNGFAVNSVETGNIWINYSPCPTCTNALLSHYNKPDDAKPTIHVARVYTESNKLTHIFESIQCLAKLKHNGFDIVPWNFNEFKAPQGVPVFVDACISDIDTYYGNANFTSAYMDLERYMIFIQQLSENPHVNSWCEV